MQMKQSQQKYAENIEAVEKRLLPAVLAPTPNNGQLIGSWLAKNCLEADGEIVDASVENIIRGIKALDSAGLIDWQIAPKVAPVKKRPDFLQSNDGAAHLQPKDAELRIQMKQERERRQKLGDAANAEIMSEAAALVSRHSSTSHSRTYREREALKKEFDRLVASKVHPKEVLAGVQAKQNSFM